MTVAINVLIILGNGLTPPGATLKLGVVNIHTGIDNIDVDTLATMLVILVTSESAEVQLSLMTDSRKPLLGSPSVPDER